MKKILSLLIALCLICSIVQMPVMAEEDIAIANPESADTLEALGIIEGFGGDLMLDKVLTRAEFVSMLVRILNIDTSNKTVYFEDVNASHWAVGAVGAACTMGIVTGVDEKHFAPDEPLAYEEAIKMLVVTLGYGPAAVRKGGYPVGYLTVAQQIGLLNGIDAKAGLLVKRALAADIIFNALDTNIVKEQIISDDIIGKVTDGKTLLREKMNVLKGTGIVTANEVTGLSVAGGVSKGMIKIDETTFYVGETNAAELLGYDVTYYADLDSADEAPYNLLYIRINERENEVITISAEDVLPTTTTTCVYYIDEDEDEETYDVSPYADMIYNGAGTGGFKASDLKPEYGTLTLVDNNRDGVADVLFVDEYETIIVGKLMKDTYTAYDRDDMKKLVKLDPNSDDYSFIIFKDGEEAEFKVVKEGTVLTVATSANTKGRKKVTVMVSDKTVSGILDAVDEDYIYIDGEEYEALGSRLGDVTAYLGSEVKAYIDSFGRVVGIDEDAAVNYTYGYLIAADTPENGGIDSNITLKILTDKSAVEVFKCAKEVTLEAETKVKPENLPTILATTKRYQGAGIEQLIRYRLNGKKEVCAIDTIASGNGGNGDSLSLDVPRTTRVVDQETNAVDSETMDIGGANQNNSRRYMSGVLGNTKNDILVDDDVIIFCIPPLIVEEIKDETGKVVEIIYHTNIDDEQYSTVGKGFLKSSGYYDAEGYDYEDDMTVKAMVIRVPSKQEMSDGTYLTIVEKVAHTVVDGEPIYKLTGYCNGNYVTAYAKNKACVSDINGNLYQTGDMLRYGLDEITGYIADGQEPYMTGGINDKVVFPTASGEYGSNKGKFFVTGKIHYGSIIYKEGLNIILDTTPDKDDDVATSCQPFLLGATSTRYFVVSEARGTITKVAEADLEKYIYGRGEDAKIAVVAGSGAPREVVIYVH